MPVPTIFYLFEHGPPQWLRDRAVPITIAIAVLTLLYLVKRYTSGATYETNKPMHGKVVMMTGATSGVGAEVAFDLAQRGAQLVLLTHAPTSDPFLADYVQELRDRTSNQLIYAEHVDLASLHSVRKFATAWIDNAPPRRLDMVILCASTMTPPGGARREVPGGGVEETWMVNYLANFHLLGILSPAIRAQPFDREVRVVIATCSSYIGAPSLRGEMTAETWTPSRAYGRSKLALTVFGLAYQKHLDAYKRPDEMPMTARVVFADPGLCRTPGTLRWLSRGTITGLALYALGYLVPWLLLKSARGGAQSILYAAMESGLTRKTGGRLIKECHEVDFARAEVRDEEVAKKLWEESDALVERTEKRHAKLRAQEKAGEVRKEDKKKEDEQVKEIESLMAAVKKGKQQQQQKENEKGKGTGTGTGTGKGTGREGEKDKEKKGGKARKRVK
ncbi:short chain dehydrogenase/reductase family [Cordyceps fumosorosea ARSEF 2679]|uniref:Short chain dehydrogenase/reductase family n=1 Tax=Cordyceps fumosorosea (strain ARSEF 2679) TaxID=1081104 RepID=A0A167R5G5_CORFA|nr:short chain dehydrogenase/reductase family [Cordyceps fumosorosea ARSEF 2679]OAA58289.1 short chain dehydrogenase/reductase family [Cordyceps fumosorosea ARSEF 2679]